ncbi:Dolichyl-diphosphooligosaccharide--protein glycosyltransferase subunit Swp1 [Dimargaris cristalligena]|uniref:Ribophorin II n=1 Tax=Dimargaris cristalligena TaxID=215637 RepID=A0A4P9ZTB8_9FUNG|nr:Dolichyl-diphosphooligosaccharide--protein glycosyltransferase subunit Swp1 [Dimargaris cristalligena]|eukprot:RKP35982.1 Dolichyl-diphosphooligosaccharide--protein glycosyltransferase subunit Swp1 [Dimargaris cristalligena]
MPIALAKTDQVDIKFTAELAMGQTTQPIRAHQAFLILTHRDHGHELVRVFDSTRQGQYSLQLRLKTLEALFKSHTGVYDADIVLGTFSVADGLRRRIAAFNIPSFQNGKTAPDSPTSSAATGTLALDTPSLVALPEIHHTPRPAPKQPFVLFPLIFALLALVPFVGLLGAWYALSGGCADHGQGVVSSVCAAADVPRLTFWGCLVGYGILYALFWTRWNLLQTLPYLAGLTVVTVVVGRSALLSMGQQRLKAE